MGELNDDTHNVTLYDEAGNPVAVIFDGSIYRLAVDAKITGIDNGITIISTPRPGKRFGVFLLNGGSSDMTVDGSSTPVEFQNGPGTGKKWFVFSISVVIEDNSINFSKFGGIPALTNGVDLKVKEAGGSEETIANFKRNGDVHIFAPNVRIESAASDILSIHSNIFENSGTTFQLKNANNEFVKLVVNDDLTALEIFNFLIRGYEVNE